MTQPDPPAVQLRRRREAATKCQPIRVGRGIGRRDPWLEEIEDAPSAFGLRRDELAAEVSRCRAAGWSGWELVKRFADPRTVAA